jgi:hypothetical protein
MRAWRRRAAGLAGWSRLGSSSAAVVGGWLLLLLCPHGARERERPRQHGGVRSGFCVGAGSPPPWSCEPQPLAHSALQCLSLPRWSVVGGRTLCLSIQQPPSGFFLGEEHRERGWRRRGPSALHHRHLPFRLVGDCMLIYSERKV